MGKGSVALASASETSDPEEGPSTVETNTSEEKHTLSRDELFEILSSHRRRFAIHYLQQHGGQGNLGEISDHVAAWENDIDVEAVSSAQRKRVYTSLQQFHLPKLDEQAVVDFEERAGNVELTEAAAELDIYLEITEAQEMPWSVYYLGLTGVGAVLVGLANLGTPILASVSQGSWIAFFLATFGVSSLIHTVTSRNMRLGSEGPPPEIN